MDLDPVTKWIGYPAGGGILLVVLWRFLARSTLGVATDQAQGQGIESVLKLSKESMSAAEESDKRARANHDLYIAEQKQRLTLEREVTTLRGEVEQLTREAGQTRELVRFLAGLVIKHDPEAAPYVQQWIRDSGYPPLDT